MTMSIAFSNQLRFGSIDRLHEILTEDDTHLTMAGGYGYVLPDSFSYGGETDALADIYYKQSEPIIRIDGLSIHKLTKSITAVGFHAGTTYFAAGGYMAVYSKCPPAPQPQTPWCDIATSIRKLDGLPIGYVTDKRGFNALHDYLDRGYLCVNGWVFNPEELLDAVPTSIETHVFTTKRTLLVSKTANVYEVVPVQGIESGCYLDAYDLIVYYVQAGKKAWVIEPLPITTDDEMGELAEHISDEPSITLADDEAPVGLKHSAPIWRPGYEDNKVHAMLSSRQLDPELKEFYVLQPLDYSMSTDTEVIELGKMAYCHGESIRYPGWYRYSVSESYLTEKAMHYYGAVLDPKAI